MRWVPGGLTTLRLLLAPGVVWNAWGPDWKTLFVAALAVAFLSDIFDGILARRWSIATPALRRYDSLADVVFYLSVAAALWHLFPGALRSRLPFLAGLILLEGAGIAVSVARFGRLPAIHAYLAKAWGILLWIASSLMLSRLGGVGWLDAALAMGMTVEIEGLAILALARRPPVDVPSLFCVDRYR
jgi:CDP-diacylglycerol--glycerol-3-phosphate 3-phosphatidyltransferase